MVVRRKAVLVREFSEGGKELSRRRGPVRLNFFDEILAEAKIITTGGTGDHGETQGNAETVRLLSVQTWQAGVEGTEVWGEEFFCILGGGCLLCRRVR
jgi:hypothetical protein